MLGILLGMTTAKDFNFRHCADDTYLEPWIHCKYLNTCTSCNLDLCKGRLREGTCVRLVLLASTKFYCLLSTLENHV